ncbi:carbohydrate ABC transporter permease [Symbiobacterium thermophilum]|uniref:Sugar ABC transporter permease protein n=1 Tax=Symbiobacterium thermophilum (strain DSM 24528 / JCM 14929 / IAM 14863 / T) TaxID=292459 RepID=Q67PU5_SYMTH|nr:carbohydrate ABC transporter permease [Symbiobacterium thermophilum]BAD40298.1 sugar ABC transporter permease protein [Symbiobacterium thermophilum IAM 14863]
MNRKLSDLIKGFLTYFLLTLGAAVIVVPLFWMVSTSLKGSDALFTYPPDWIPRPPVWRNYVDAWRMLPFGRFLLNTLFITVLAMAAELLTTSLVAFGFARFQFRGRDTLFFILLCTMMLPGVVTMIPSFMIWARLKQVDTFVPLTVGAWFAWGPAYIFMMRQFFLTIPREMEEAAIIDGANIVQIYWHIMLPLIRPALLAIGVLAFQGNWNNFQSPLIYLHSTDHFPLILGLKFFEQSLSKEAPMWNYMMAISVLMALPILGLFFAAQRYFIEGLNVGATKG